MRWLKFVAFNALGAALWVGTWVTLGYFAGQHIATIYHYIAQYSYYLLIVLAVAFVGYVVYRLRKRGKAEPGKAEAGKAEAGKAEPAAAEPAAAEAGKAEPGKAEAGKAEAGEAEPGEAEPAAAEPAAAERERAERGEAAREKPENEPKGAAAAGLSSEEPAASDQGAEPGSGAREASAVISASDGEQSELGKPAKTPDRS